MVDKTRTQIETASGHTFDYDNMNVNMIRTQDVALALGKLCRYNGHSRVFYSVAEHCFLMAAYAMDVTDDPEIALQCLLHDAGEAYVSDVPSPLKAKLGQVYKDLEAEVDELIAFKYGLPTPLFDIVHELDKRICLDEKAVLYPTSRYRWVAEQQGLEPLGIKLALLNPSEAALAFLHMYNLLTGENVTFKSENFDL